MSRAWGEVLGADIADAQRRSEARWSPWSEPGVLWRVEAVRYSAKVEAEGVGAAYYTTAPQLEVFGEPVGKWTPCGARLLYSGRWVDLRPHAKQYASRTVAEAVEQFAARRRGQLHILDRQVCRAQEDAALAAKVLTKEEVKCLSN